MRGRLEEHDGGGHFTRALRKARRGRGQVEAGGGKVDEARSAPTRHQIVYEEEDAGELENLRLTSVHLIDTI